MNNSHLSSNSNSNSNSKSKNHKKHRNEKKLATEAVLRRHTRTMTMFAIRSLAFHHFESTMNVLLSSENVLSSEILYTFVGLVCPPGSPRALDDVALPTTCTQPMLQQVIERCIAILNSAPTGTAGKVEPISSRRFDNFRQFQAMV